MRASLSRSILGILFAAAMMIPTGCSDEPDVVKPVNVPSAPSKDDPFKSGDAKTGDKQGTAVAPAPPPPPG